MSEPEATRAYRGIAPADRRAERRKRLQNAVIDVVADEGWSAATVRKVAATAGVGPRFFYESFTDMNDLVTTAYDELGATLLEGAVDAIAAAPDELHAKARAAVGAIVGAVERNPQQGRFLISDAPPLAERKSAFIRSAADELAKQSDAVGTRLDSRQAELCAVVVMAGAVELVRRWLDGTLDIRPDELIEIVASTLSTLTAHMPTIGR
ncbi:transcriptional regulator, TetR family [Rhodococcus rhodochrous J3]|uniref:TetR family transcriptional regulator n=2 Tax=Rhodococcus rhodochrous TaxID=1829 RepID=A0AA46WWD8_RHORH|nr:MULTISPECIES: TetR family transcriptional regulator [Rhodococcus]MBF4477555.1 TetR/AcrR family transcriptional regulator [Rhodococcus rhodochrous]MCB8911015.1 TetR family transcriptional regulator [Rhodococcus rhodochrous]MCD2097954.1 TetR family transcriptional regulator [Rhodococcus rhodochrous]MCD2122080.1 TetR family transcriptional regulator [Rhodococcus rhodochrous]MCQ4133979.1 TetR family transcriptional regulator [Rhodococcus rhodochrous]